MSTFTEAVTAATKKVEAAETAYEQAKSRYATVKAVNGQQGYSIAIGGHVVVVAENQGRDGGWAAKVRRGCELMHLGALKALDAEVDAALLRVRKAERELESAVWAGGRCGLPL